MTETWQFWALSAAVFAAMTAILAKLGVDTMDPDAATLVRTAVVLVLLAAILVFRGKIGALASIDRRAALFLLLSGLATGASWLCYFRALKLGEASRVAPIDKLSVVFVAVLGALLLGERLSATGWLGVAMIAGGAVLIAL
ncbi:MAG: EamA family transporter [Flavobacteriaceae bacterium]